MPSAATLTPENRFVALFVGESGSGKTVAECSFPGPIDVDDFDGRIRGILGAPWIDKSKISYDYYPPKRSIEDGTSYEKINKKYEAMQIMLKTGQSQIKTKILDSLTSETFAMLCDAAPLTHNKTYEGRTREVGKRLGSLIMLGPEDYGFESQATYNIISFLRSIAIPNIIVSAHFVDRYGKPKTDEGKENPYADSVVIGKKLSIRDKIGANIMPYFDHVFEFYRYTDRFTVKFRGELARTSYAELPNGEVDITGKSFYDVMMGFIKKPQAQQ